MEMWLKMPPCPQPRQTSTLPLPSTHPALPALAHPFSAQQGARAGQRRRQYRRWCQPTARGSGGNLPGGQGLHLTLALGLNGSWETWLTTRVTLSSSQRTSQASLSSSVKWSCCGPCLRPDRKGLQGSLTTKGPEQMIPSPGRLSPRDTAAKSPRPTLALAGEETQSDSFQRASCMSQCMQPL